MLTDDFMSWLSLWSSKAGLIIIIWANPESEKSYDQSLAQPRLGPRSDQSPCPFHCTFLEERCKCACTLECLVHIWMCIWALCTCCIHVSLCALSSSCTCEYAYVSMCAKVFTCAHVHIFECVYMFVLMVEAGVGG